MAIPVNPGNFGGLLGLAGRNTGSLGIRGATDGLFQGMARGLQQGQARAMANRQHQDTQGLRERQLGLQEQELQARKDSEAKKFEMAQLLSQKQEVTHKQGSFAAYARIAMEKAETPEAAKEVKQSIIDEAVSEQFIDEDTAKKLHGAPISQFKSMLDYKILQLGKVNEYRKMLDSKQAKGGASGGEVSITRPDGTVIHLQEPKAAVESGLQNDVIDKDVALQELTPIRDDFNSKYFTYKGQSGLAMAKQAEKLEGVPLLSTAARKVATGLTGVQPENQSAFIQDATKYLNSVEQFFQQRYRKPITGAAAAVAELKQLRKAFLSGDMSPSEFRGALDQILRMYAGEAEFKKNVLREGIDVAPNIEATRKAYKEKGWSDERINKALKMGGY